jgi:hypothetical protein
MAATLLFTGIFNLISNLASIQIAYIDIIHNETLHTTFWMTCHTYLSLRFKTCIWNISKFGEYVTKYKDIIEDSVRYNTYIMWRSLQQPTFVSVTKEDIMSYVKTANNSFGKCVYLGEYDTDSNSNIFTFYLENQFERFATIRKPRHLQMV